jgi:hypothetical protein
MEHIARWFQFLDEQPVLFFCEEEMLPELHAIANKNVEFCIQPFKDLDVFDEYPEEFWKQQVERDPEPYHTWQLGAIWASKKYFLKRAAEVYPDEEWFVWVDAGCIRKNQWMAFTPLFTRRDIFTAPGVYLQCLKPIPPVEEKCYFHFPDVHIAGAIILAHRDYIKPFVEEYNAVLDCYDSLHIPAIMDQYVLASMRVPWLYTIHLPQATVFPDDWFFFLGLL